MKPKLFIGSSVEGLNIAYAVQQNLTQDAESTVWDQGVFELSKTTVESLDKVLDSVDFGVFVFSPDDMTIMRGSEVKTIRDNVLFELGLFIGKLSRERVFYIVPEGSTFHIPTDLIGVTPGKYNPKREDNSLQAATGAVCNQIRNQIKKLGLYKNADTSEKADESDSQISHPDDDWLKDFLNEDYKSAKEKLKKTIKTKSGEDLKVGEAWIEYIDYKIDDKEGLQKLIDLSTRYKTNVRIQTIVSSILSWEDHYEKAINIAEQALKMAPSNNELIVLIAQFYKNNGDLDKSIEILNNSIPAMNPDVAIALAEVHFENNNLNEAINTVHTTYLNFPRNESLLYKYARLLQDEGRHKEALYLLDILTKQHPKNVEYWGYLSNSCLILDLYNNSLIACKTAEELSDGKHAWILHNIGNLYNNKDFYSEAISWLNKGLTIEPSSQYAHDRLAGAIKNQNDERKQFDQICREGRKLIRNYSIETSKDT